MNFKIAIIALSTLFVTACEASPPTKVDVAVAFQMRLGKMGMHVVIPKSNISNLSCYEIDGGSVWKCSFDLLTPATGNSRSTTKSLTIKLRQNDNGYWIQA